jgi:hypothetical protein
VTVWCTWHNTWIGSALSCPADKLARYLLTSLRELKSKILGLLNQYEEEEEVVEEVEEVLGSGEGGASLRAG